MRERRRRLKLYDSFTDIEIVTLQFTQGEEITFVFPGFSSLRRTGKIADRESIWFPSRYNVVATVDIVHRYSTRPCYYCKSRLCSAFIEKGRCRLLL